MENIEWIVFVTRHYHWLVNPVILLSDKYIDVPLTFFSDRKIDNVGPRHKVIEVFPLDCPIYRTQCCNLIKAALQKIDKPLVAIIMTDLLPQNHVDHNKLRAIEDFMLSNQVARTNLWHDPRGLGGFNIELEIQKCIDADPSVILSQDQDLKIAKLSPVHPKLALLGATSLMPAIWNKQFLIEFMEDGWSFDKIEMPGQWKFVKQNKWYSAGTVPSLEEVAHLMFTHDQSFIDISAIKKEDQHLVSPYVPVGFKVKL